MSAYRDKDRGGFDEILHAFASIIKTLHFLGAFAVVYVMMNKIGEASKSIIEQKLGKPSAYGCKFRPVQFIEYPHSTSINQKTGLTHTFDLKTFEFCGVEFHLLGERKSG